MSTRNLTGRSLRFVGAALVATLEINPGTALAASHPSYRPDVSIEHDLGYKLPPAPDNRSEIGRLDLAIVAMQVKSEPVVQEQAFRDASAYSSDQLISRFSMAAGTDLSPKTNPILAHILKLVLNDTGAYASFAKAQNPRPRPYIEDPQIVPCETDYLRSTDNQSYPSGHATNGYAAALVLAQVIPQRAQALLARGIRYADNRVVCGVHHPIDVEQGRYLAIAVTRSLQSQQAYRDDIACAREEYDRSNAGSAPGTAFSAKCGALDKRYRAELGLPPQL